MHGQIDTDDLEVESISCHDIYQRITCSRLSGTLPAVIVSYLELEVGT